MVDAKAPDPNASVNERDLLRSLLKHLGARVKRDQLETWFRTLDVDRADDNELVLTVTSQFVRDWLQRNYLGLLQEAAAQLGQPRRRIVVAQREEDGWDTRSLIGSSVDSALGHGLEHVLGRRDELDLARAHAAPNGSARGESDLGGPGPFLATACNGSARALSGQAGAAGHPGTGAVVGDRGLPGGQIPARRNVIQLNPNYTFDKFVVGSCNRLAHASALAIGENPGCAYNPLFVHGNVGLGKSHLLQAICHTVIRRDQAARVIYMSCEDFTNAFILAIQNGQLESFREHYRSADMLVIDDVQFLANKEKTQDEFFHTFNALYDGQKQIILSSDRSPAGIPTIEERLVSRFKWGLVAEVEAPCVETRTAIVRRKAMGRGADLPDDVARYLAERVTTNIRELEGAVIKVVGIAAITDQPITLALAESCMRGLPVRHAQVSTDDVMTLVTTEFAITSRELIGKSRTQTVSLPRQIAMFLLREHTESSLEDVGRVFGNRDHTTVLYAVTKIRERTQKDRAFKELVEGLTTRLLTRSFRN
jgi:chromosomal replication initiator protein